MVELCHYNKYEESSMLRNMSKVITVANQKGGVGKTTSAVNLSSYIALAGKRTLLIDLDPQGNATSGFGVDRSGLKASSYDLIINETSAAEIIQSTQVSGLDLLPATIDLAGAEIEMINKMSRETILRGCISEIQEKYDFIIIDAPPSLGLLTLNALVTCDSVLLPIQAEYYALEGISQMLKTIDLVKRQLNPGLTICKVLITMYDNRMKLSKQVRAEVEAYFRDKVCKTVIPRSIRLSEAPSHGMPIVLYDPKSAGAIAYAKVAQEIIDEG